MVSWWPLLNCWITVILTITHQNTTNSNTTGVLLSKGQNILSAMVITLSALMTISDAFLLMSSFCGRWQIRILYGISKQIIEIKLTNGLQSRKQRGLVMVTPPVRISMSLLIKISLLHQTCFQCKWKNVFFLWIFSYMYCTHLQVVFTLGLSLFLL